MKYLLPLISITSLLLESSAFVPSNGAQRFEAVGPLFGKRMKFQPPAKVVESTEYIQIKPDGEDVWRTMDTVEILQKGGIGVIPTDTGYCLVTPLASKTGLERLFRIQNMEGYEAPVQLLCSDLKTIDEYCFNIDKMNFKILKNNLPGPYTFILPGKTTLPKTVLEGNKQLQTVGVRMPDDTVIRYLQDELLGGMPLLMSPLGGDELEDDDKAAQPWSTCHIDPDASWCTEVDFIVDAGGRPRAESTIYDLTRRGDPLLVQEGLGELELAL